MQFQIAESRTHVLSYDKHMNKKQNTIQWKIRGNNNKNYNNKKK